MGEGRAPPPICNFQFSIFNPSFPPSAFRLHFPGSLDRPFDRRQNRRCPGIEKGIGRVARLARPTVYQTVILLATAKHCWASQQWHPT